MLDSNEKAAIAAGLWKPHTTAGHREPPCDCQPAPDMHDPVNLFRGMMNRWQDLLKMKRMWTDERLLTLVAFDCLVTLYEAEHPDVV